MLLDMVEEQLLANGKSLHSWMNTSEHTTLKSNQTRHDKILDVTFAVTGKKICSTERVQELIFKIFLKSF